MATQTLSMVYGVNEGLVLSPSELLQFYFYGIEIKAKDGSSLSDYVWIQKILAAQSEVEKFLSVKLFRQVMTERLDFIRNDYYNWGFFKVTFPVREPLGLLGFIGTVQQIEYPLSWVSHMAISDESLYGRTLHIVPTGSSTSSQGTSVVFSGITPHLGFLGVDQIPNYWQIKYDTGFKEIPSDIIDVVGKMAAIQIFTILGDIVLGAGIASMSLGVDGLSQSISTTSSAENSAYSARVKQYMSELKYQKAELKNYYKGLNFLAL